MSEAGPATLRDLDAADLDWMADRERELFGPSAWSREMIGHDFAYGASRYRGIEVDGRLAGYAVYGFEGDAFHLMNLAVLPEHRRRGLGRAFMRDLLAECARLGVAAVWLEVAVTNAGAIALYRDFGFRDVRVRPRYYQPEDVDALVMRLDLGAATDAP